MTTGTEPALGRRIVATGAILALLAVGAGAFAAHGLKSVLNFYQLGIFETAARYQMYHAIALLAVGTIASRPGYSVRWLKLASLAFVLGVVLFSGSLYALALTGIGILGAVTPLGGFAFMIGWLALVLAALKPLPADRQG